MAVCDCSPCKLLRHYALLGNFELKLNIATPLLERRKFTGQDIHLNAYLKVGIIQATLSLVIIHMGMGKPDDNFTIHKINPQNQQIWNTTKYKPFRKGSRKL